MAINWDGLGSTIKSYFVTKSAPDRGTTAAKFIAMQYHVAMLSGGEMLAGNMVIKPNPVALENMIALSFTRGYTVWSGMYDSLELIGRGLQLYWMGAVLAPMIPPPGAIAVINNICLSPGQFFSMPLPPTLSDDLWVDVFIGVARTHALSLSGQMVVLIPTFFGPVPMVLPWFGYR